MHIRLLLAVAVLCLGLAGAEGKSRDPIRFAAGGTPAEQVVQAITVRALEKAGFRSDVVPLGNVDLVRALGDGTVHAHLSVAVADYDDLPAALDGKEILSLGGLATNDPTAPVQKLVWSGMKSKWPYAQKMLKRMVLPPDLIDALAAEVEAGASPDDVAAAWWAANKKTWSPWIAASKNWMKP